MIVPQEIFELLSFDHLIPSNFMLNFIYQSSNSDKFVYINNFYNLVVHNSLFLAFHSQFLSQYISLSFLVAEHIDTIKNIQ